MKRIFIGLILAIVAIVFSIEGCENWKERSRLAYERSVAIAAGRPLPSVEKVKEEVDQKILKENPLPNTDTHIRKENIFGVGKWVKKPSTPTTPPVVAESPPDLSKDLPKQPTVAHPSLTGLEFIGISKELPNGLFKNTNEEMYWYIMDETKEMGMMKIAGITGVVVACEGPVIYDMIISEPGKKGVNLRIRKTNDPGVNQGQTWDWKKKEWGPVHEFEYTKIFNISGVRIMKNPEDPTPIRVEIGIPKK